MGIASRANQHRIEEVAQRHQDAVHSIARGGLKTQQRKADYKFHLDALRNIIRIFGKPTGENHGDTFEF